MIAAYLESERRGVWVAVLFLLVNGIIGALGAPVAAALWGVGHPAALALLAFGLAYAGHDLFATARAAARHQIHKRIGGVK